VANFLIDHPTITITGSATIVLLSGWGLRHIRFHLKRKDTTLSIGKIDPNVDVSGTRAGGNIDLEVNSGQSLKATSNRAGRDFKLKYGKK
jgi:hypothetical protein